MLKRILSLAIGVYFGGSHLNWGQAAEIRAAGKNADTQPISLSLPPTFSLTYGKSTKLCVTVSPPSNANLVVLTVSKPEAIFSKSRIIDPTCAGAAFELKSSHKVSSCDQIDEIKAYATLSGSAARKAESVGRLVRPINMEATFHKNTYASGLYADGSKIVEFRPAFGGFVSWKLTAIASDGVAVFTDLPIDEVVHPQRELTEFKSDGTGRLKPPCSPLVPDQGGNVIGQMGVGNNSVVDQVGAASRYFLTECFQRRDQILNIGKCTLPKRTLALRADVDGNFNTARTDREGSLGNPSPTITREDQLRHANDNMQ